MFTVEERTTIARPVEDVFAYVANLRNIPAWRPDVLEIEGAPETLDIPSRLVPGTAFKEWINFGGRKAWGMQVREVQAGRRAVFEATSGPGVRPTQTFLFEPDGGSTHVTFRGEIRTLGAYRLIEPLLPRVIRRNWQRYLANLKALLEGGTASRAA